MPDNHTISVYSAGTDGLMNMSCSCGPDELWEGCHVGLAELNEIAHRHIEKSESRQTLWAGYGDSINAPRQQWLKAEVDVPEGHKQPVAEYVHGLDRPELDPRRGVLGELDDVWPGVMEL